MRILVAFEYSGVESAEFRKRGHTVRAVTEEVVK